MGTNETPWNSRLTAFFVGGKWPGFLRPLVFITFFFVIFTEISLNGHLNAVYNVEEIMKPNFESVWKTLQEVAESHKETARLVQELKAQVSGRQ
jgi:hypothetical protein